MVLKFEFYDGGNDFTSVYDDFYDLLFSSVFLGSGDDFAKGDGIRRPLKV